MPVPFLGVDGGGTKTAFAIISQTRELLSCITTGPSNPHQIGIHNVPAVLEAGVKAVVRQAGLTKKDTTFSFWGLPGFGEDLDHISILESTVANILQSDRYRCGNDVEAGWAGSLACQPGIHLVAGTGAIGFGVDPKGNTARSSGWGELIGDEGSAHWLGKRLLELFSKQSDGRLPKSQLYHVFKSAAGLRRDYDLLAKLDQLRKRDEVARLAPLLQGAAVQGDANAIAVFREAAYEHSLMVKAIIQQLDFPSDKPIPVSYSGGVFKSGEYILQPLQEYLTPLNATLVQPKLTPVMGACLYAMVLAGRTVETSLIRKLQEAEKALV